TLTEMAPAGTQFNAASSTPGWVNHGGTFTFTVGNLAAGAAAPGVVFAVTANNPLPAGVGQTTNTATAADDGSAGADPTPGDNTASATIVFANFADVVVTQAGPATAAAGTNVTYAITVSNNGPADAQNVTLSDALPAGT